MYLSTDAALLRVMTPSTPIARRLVQLDLPPTLWEAEEAKVQAETLRMEWDLPTFAVAS